METFPSIFNFLTECAVQKVNDVMGYPKELVECGDYDIVLTESNKTYVVDADYYVRILEFYAEELTKDLDLLPSEPPPVWKLEPVPQVQRKF
jgi:hypothetical protein